MESGGPSSPDWGFCAFVIEWAGEQWASMLSRPRFRTRFRNYIRESWLRREWTD